MTPTPVTRGDTDVFTAFYGWYGPVVFELLRGVLGGPSRAVRAPEEECSQVWRTASGFDTSTATDNALVDTDDLGTADGTGPDGSDRQIGRPAGMLLPPAYRPPGEIVIVDPDQRSIAIELPAPAPRHPPAATPVQQLRPVRPSPARTGDGLIERKDVS